MDEQIPDAGDFRRRIVREDDLLNSRTTLFLVTSGLLLTAVGLGEDELIKISVSTLGIIVTTGWLMTSLQNWSVIANLTREYRKHHAGDYIERIVQDSLLPPGWRRPTYIIAIILPMVFLITWMFIMIVYLYRWYAETI